MALQINKKNKLDKKPDYSEHLEAKPITAIATVSKKSFGNDLISTSESETLHQGVFGNGMSISVEGGRTMNLGNYESAKVGVTITVPCEQQNLNEAYDWACNWLSSKIDEAVKLAKGQ